MIKHLKTEDWDRIKFMIDRASRAKSSANFLNSYQDEIPSDIRSTIENTKFGMLSELGSSLDDDLYKRLVADFSGIIHLKRMQSYKLLARCIDDQSDKTVLLRLAADEIIENELDEMIETLEQIKEQLKEYLIETDQM